MAERRGRRFFRVALVLALIGMTAGCIQIPATGPVHQGRMVGAVPRAYVRIIGVPPAPDATPLQIVRGFLRASADISDDYRVAREYLTTRVSSGWRPDEASTVVFDANSQVQLDFMDDQGRAVAEEDLGADTEISLVTARLRAPVVARVDPSGRYEASDGNNVQEWQFRLEKVNGEWRITGMDNGVLLSLTDFDDTFWSLPVYFADPTGGWLVPDVRWFPARSSTATTLVQAVLDGPPYWLAPAVTTGAPEGTRMTRPSVPIQGGVAMVDLTAEALAADPVHRQMLKAQLEATLTGLPAMAQASIDSVEITVETSRYDITSGPAAMPTDGQPPEPGPRLITQPVVEDRPVVLSGGHLMWLEDDAETAIPGVSDVELAGASWAAAATDGSAYAVLSESGVAYVDAGGRSTTLLAGGKPLVAPSFDPLGWVWTARAVPGGPIVAARLGQGVRTVSGDPWPSGFRVTSVRVSRDGTRVLIGGEQAGRASLSVRAVKRDADQVPVGLGPALSVMPDLAEVRAAAWVDQRSVVILGRRTGESTQVWRIEIGGPATSLGQVPGASTVTAGNGEIYAGTTESVVYRWDQRDWERVGTGDWPALPG